MDCKLLREPSVDGVTFGVWSIDGVPFCYTLEDEIREVPGEPVHLWKVRGKTAIPSGIYPLTLEQSPRFGPDTITINDVPGFDKIRVHGGNDVDDTDGCPIVGSKIIRAAGRISGAVVDGVLDNLKAAIREGLADGPVWLTIINPE